MTVCDVAPLIQTPLKVFDITTEKTLFSAPFAPGSGFGSSDLPSNVAMLPVVQIIAVNDWIFIEVRTNN